ncbi:hypothetical protein GWI33_018513 [Rhynchophorus ferrugineus]|uniref:Uncharacterized protein n=1 Tax=Rhynchophorus ferrugineus TaxID=354439 RepID=A0A834M7Z1_RHYFE|nr:hypothetical protein GWI33_018513 [Rhynchophorus ferrugineus]
METIVNNGAVCEKTLFWMAAVCSHHRYISVQFRSRSGRSASGGNFFVASISIGPKSTRSFCEENDPRNRRTVVLEMTVSRVGTSLAGWISNDNALGMALLV